jgi:hypothetical protein
VPTKKKSCELVHQGIAGPAPDQILEAIKAEYWLPASTPPESSKDTTQSDQPTKTKPQVKP